MNESKKPAPEIGAQAREVWRIGDIEVEFSKAGLRITVREDDKPALTPKDLGPYFKELRERAGLTLEETAKVTGVDIGELKSAEEYGFKEKSLEFYNLCHLFRVNGNEIGKKYGLPLTMWEIRAKALEDRAEASETEKHTESRAEVDSAKPNRERPVRAMFISLMLTNVATLLLCAGQLLMWFMR